MYKEFQMEVIVNIKPIPAATHLLKCKLGTKPKLLQMQHLRRQAKRLTIFML